MAMAMGDGYVRVCGYGCSCLLVGLHWILETNVSTEPEAVGFGLICSREAHNPESISESL